MRIVKLFDEVRTADALEVLFDTATLLRLVPEEILALGQFVALTLGREHGFEGIGVVACVPHLGGDGHGRGGEVLNLFEVEVQLFGDDSQLRHILLLTTWVGGDEVGDDLLVQVLFAIDTVEDALELIELLERGLAHQSEHTVAGMFRGHLQASADMAADQLTGVCHR